MVFVLYMQLKSIITPHMGSLTDQERRKSLRLSEMPSGKGGCSSCICDIIYMYAFDYIDDTHGRRVVLVSYIDGPAYPYLPTHSYRLTPTSSPSPVH